VAELASPPSLDHPALGAKTARARRRWRLPFSPWHLILMPASLVMVLPLVWMVDTSFMTDAEINRFPPTIVPSGISLGGYSQVLSESHYPRWFLNSVIVSGTTVIAQLVLCSLAGYAFARIRFAGRTLMFLLMMATLLIPFQLTMIPFFVLMHDLHLIDSLPSLIVPYLTSVFGVFLLRQFFLGLPVELEEAARIDGCTRLGVFLKILLPLSKPALAALAVVTFLDSWNNLIWPLIAIQTDVNDTVQLGLSSFESQHHVEWAAVNAANVITTLPVFLVFIVGQKYFVQALSGAIKG
jgi:multiple sugar transport system permease protein